jgi:DTW domain-containing protein YfiP
VILQHTDEVKKPLGTAKIVSLCLTNVVLKAGVDFSNDAYLNQLLSGADNHLAILYPFESSVTLEGWHPITVSSQEQLKTEKPQRTLIVLDGTWRNAREIINLNPQLKRIPAVKLTPVAQSNYRIRKAPFSDSLSTVEAVSQALKILEPETSVDPMLNCFHNMIDYQISRMGEDVYRKNYLEQGRECD